MNAGTPAVLLLSGGIDSTVLLHHAVGNLGCGPVHCLSFSYGQRHEKELDAARWQAKQMDAARHEVVDLSFLGGLLKQGSALLSGGAKVPALDAVPEEERSQPPTYVPNRNMILLSLAAAYAEANGITDVYYGAQALDTYGYWDCTPQFLERVNQVFGLNRKEPVSVHAPLIRLAKRETVQLGTELGVDFGHTWTCYRGGEKACGVCPTCAERLAAFRDCGLTDPLPYAKQRSSG